MNHQPKRIALFASGTGSNAKKIIEYFAEHNSIKVALVVCNNQTAGVISIANGFDIPVLLIERKPFFNGDAYLAELKKHAIDFVVLAGFLWKVPTILIDAFQQKIINIHPALLPKYGGKGMYGHFIHEAVIVNKEKETGISIHWVNEHFDEGEIIFQASCSVEPTDAPESLAKKVLTLEHKHFAPTIESVLLKSSFHS